MYRLCSYSRVRETHVSRMYVIYYKILYVMYYYHMYATVAISIPVLRYIWVRDTYIESEDRVEFVTSSWHIHKSVCLSTSSFSIRAKSIAVCAKVWLLTHANHVSITRERYRTHDNWGGCLYERKRAKRRPCSFATGAAAMMWHVHLTCGNDFGPLPQLETENAFWFQLKKCASSWVANTEAGAFERARESEKLH